MTTRFNGLQVALHTALQMLDGKEEFGLAQVLDEVRAHNATLLDGMSEGEARSAVTMTLDNMRIDDGALGWMQLDFVATTQGYVADKTADAGMAQLMQRHPEVGEMKLPALEAFTKWMQTYGQRQQQQLAEMERHLELMQETGAPTLGEAVEQTATSIIERAKESLP